MPVLGKERVEVVRSLSIRGQPGRHSEPYQSVVGGGEAVQMTKIREIEQWLPQRKVYSIVSEDDSPPTTYLHFKFNFSLENTVSLNKRGRKPTP